MMNRIILATLFTVIVFEFLVSGGANQLGGPLFVEGSLNHLDLSQAWKCADVIQNPDAVREELVTRKVKDDHKIRKFIENCIKWGDGWRFKKDGSSLSSRIKAPYSMPIYYSSGDVLSSDNNFNINQLLRYLLWKNLIKHIGVGHDIKTKQNSDKMDSLLSGTNSLETLGDSSNEKQSRL